MDSGLVGLRMKEVIPTEPLAISKNRLVLGWACSSASKLLKMSKHHKIQKVKDLINTPGI